MSDAQNTETNAVMLCAKITRYTIALCQNMEGRKNKVPSANHGLVPEQLAVDWWKGSRCRRERRGIDLSVFYLRKPISKSSGNTSSCNMS